MQLPGNLPECTVNSCSSALQAIGRSWRMGQKREVSVSRVFVANTVEKRIIEVVRARQAGGPSIRDEMMHTHGRSQVRRRVACCMVLAGEIWGLFCMGTSGHTCA